MAYLPASAFIVVTTSCFVLWQESKIDMSELQLKAAQLAEMVSLIEDGTISGKIGKQILPDLLQVCLKAEVLALTNRYTGIAPALDSFFLQILPHRKGKKCSAKTALTLALACM